MTNKYSYLVIAIILMCTSCGSTISIAEDIRDDNYVSELDKQLRDHALSKNAETVITKTTANIENPEPVEVVKETKVIPLLLEETDPSVTIPKSGIIRPVDSKRFTEKYDVYFRKYSKRFFGVGFEWRWFKSQSIAESALKNDAVSWVGARGLMQLMPGTAAEIRREQSWIGDTEQEEWNIAGGIYYDSKVIKSWNPALRNLNNRLALMFGSYNAGVGNILHYQKRCIREGSDCGSCNDWCGIVKYSNKESIGYVKRIFEMMNEKF